MVRSVVDTIATTMRRLHAEDPDALAPRHVRRRRDATALLLSSPPAKTAATRSSVVKGSGERGLCDGVFHQVAEALVQTMAEHVGYGHEESLRAAAVLRRCDRWLYTRVSALINPQIEALDRRLPPYGTIDIFELMSAQLRMRLKTPPPPVLWERAEFLACRMNRLRRYERENRASLHPPLCHPIPEIDGYVWLADTSRMANGSPVYDWFHAYHTGLKHPTHRLFDDDDLEDVPINPHPCAAHAQPTTRVHPPTHTSTSFARRLRIRIADDVAQRRLRAPQAKKARM